MSAAFTSCVKSVFTKYVESKRHGGGGGGGTAGAPLASLALLASLIVVATPNTVCTQGLRFEKKKREEAVKKKI
jgi:hypothetical protein